MFPHPIKNNHPLTGTEFEGNIETLSKYVYQFETCKIRHFALKKKVMNLNHV